MELIKLMNLKEYLNFSTLSIFFNNLISLVQSFRYIFVCEISLQSGLIDYAFKEIRKYPSFIIKGGFSSNNEVYSNLEIDVIVKLPEGPFVRLSFEPETDDLSKRAYITFFRWDLSKVVTFLSRINSIRTHNEVVAVEMVSSSWPEGTQIGIVGNVDEPYLEKEAYTAIEADIALCALEKKKKVGIILHGPPGNGKTSLIKYFANKYKLPIKIVIFSEYLDNQSLTRIFSKLPSKCIVLLEDFDRILHKNSSVDSSKTKVSLDGLLNGLDGIYSNYNGVVFIATMNNIDALDDSLKRRPSRFKHQLELGPPTEKIRNRIFKNDKKLVDETAGVSLDHLLMLRESSEDE